MNTYDGSLVCTMSLCHYVTHFISVAELGPYQGPNLSLGTPQQSRDNTVTENNVEKRRLGKRVFL